MPVKALVVLKQAPENRLRELTGFEKVAEVSGSVFYPTWLEDGMELCTDTLNHLLTDLPVYRLDNRADRESVEILAKEQMCIRDSHQAKKQYLFFILFYHLKEMNASKNRW